MSKNFGQRDLLHFEFHSERNPKSHCFGVRKRIQIFFFHRDGRFPQLAAGSFNSKMRFLAFIVLAMFFASSVFGGRPVISTVSPSVLRTIPHDSRAFTQGLFYDNGLLYESTGLYGQSSLRIIDVKNGDILKNIPVPDIFAEGCARMDSMLVQLSWRENGAPIYSFSSLSPRGSFSYTGEGWGLTSDTSVFYMSNGSDTMYVRNKQFAIIRKVAVRQHSEPLTRINELEYVKGLIYANVWFDNNIYVIRPSTGVVVRIIDCSSLVMQNASHSSQDVLNGIAYNPGTETFYITGKCWRYIFEVKLP
jgi:glutamine cyclotransferase